MSAVLPELSLDDFRHELAESSPVELGEPAVGALFHHYQELRRWNPRLSLVGPGTAGEVISRHYGEALHGLYFLPKASAQSLTSVDIGSGGGFPGFVLAAARPDLEMTLVEARQRKWSFLQAVCRRTEVACSCVNSRVEAPLPEGLPDTIGLLTLRALSLPGPVFEALRARFSPTGRLLIWQTLPQGDPPPGFRRLRTLALPGSDRRCIGEYGSEP